MSAAICTTGQMANVMGTRRARGGSVSATNAYVWSFGNATAVVASTIAAIPVFADTKLHARRPKEASQ